jgi:mono/diheme cytochrome c family protein
MKAIRILIPALLTSASLGAAEIDAAALYKQHCFKCHGTYGKAETKMGKNLKLKDYTDPAVQEKMTDEEMIAATRDGVFVDGKEKMKAFKDKLSEDEIKAITALIRTFKGKTE